MAKLGAASKLNTDRGFLGRLRDAGRRHADDWLAANFDLLGARSAGSPRPIRAWSRKVGTGFRKRSCSSKKLKRDDDSKKSHRALAAAS
jgi:hypothetical protein